MSLDVLLDHFDLLIDAPDGVFRLREVIYDLALQGKLVAQDADDEPASSLLERVEEEKRRLYKEKRIRKPKRLTSVSEEEKPYALPENWTWVRLGTVGEINPRNDAEDKMAASFIPMTLIDDGFGTGHDTEERPWGDVRKGYTHFAEGDVGLAKITPCYQNRKSAIFRNLTNGIGAGTTELHIFRPYAGAVSPEFALLFFQSPRFIENGKARMTGTAGQQRVPRSYVEEAVLPLPPLEEQKRIVAKVDALMRLCDTLEAQQQQRQTARVHLNSAALDTLLAAENGDLPRRWQFVQDHFDLLYADPQNVAKLRQAILQLAVQGELVPQDPSDEPTSALLERIKEEKQRLYKEGQIRKPKKLPAVAEEEKPFALPEGWMWVRFGDVSFNRDGERIPLSRAQRAEREGPYDYYGASGVIDKIDDYLFDKPLLLIGEDGANLLLRSKPIAFIAHGKYWVNNHAHVIDALNFDLLRYFEVFVNATNLEPYVTGTAQPKMNQAKMNSIPVALPPLPEQERIVAKVDELMRLCDALEERLARSQEQSERLLQAVLHAAFAEEGETAEVT